jgi:two-component system, OmpR family, phosphate regulon sensor histidine kinase PhoR
VEPGATTGTAPAASGGTASPSHAPSRWTPPRSWWSAGRIVVAYALVSFAWIAFSDQALLVLVPDPVERSGAETIKGGLFILVTSVLLYALIRRSEAGIRSLGSEVRATIDSLSEGVLLVDGASNVVEANRAAIELLAVPSKEALLGPLRGWGARFELRYPDAGVVPFERYAARRALAGERVIPYEAVLRRADGRELFASISLRRSGTQASRSSSSATSRPPAASRRSARSSSRPPPTSSRRRSR